MKTIYLAVTLPDEFKLETVVTQRVVRNIARALTTQPVADSGSIDGVYVNVYADSDSIEAEADRIKRAAYFSSVRRITDDLKSEIESGNITDRDAAIEYLDQTVDSNYYVTYTHAIFECLRYSDNHDAYTEEMGDVPRDESRDIRWPALAFMAMRRDVLDLLDALDIDLDSIGGTSNDEETE